MKPANLIFLVLGFILIVLFSGCHSPGHFGLTAPEEQFQPPAEDGRTDLETVEWRTAELRDIRTGETFRISDFAGKPILLESFAVWCPTCLQQQRKIAELRERTGDDFVHISIDTDPNEDENRVRGHIERHGFDWLFAVSPTAVTQDLIDEFGLTVVNAPSAPVVLVCEDQSARLLRSGVKSADDLLAEIERGC